MSDSLAIFGDVHSNLEALHAVISDAESLNIKRFVCLGDIVGYASGVRSCLSAVRELGCPVLLGNHDEAACMPAPPEDFNENAAAGVILAASRLRDADREWIKSLPRSIEMWGVMFTHASLASSRGWPYILSPESAQEHFAAQTTHLAFCGHTHRPMVWHQPESIEHVVQQPGKGTVFLPLGGKVLANVGSVGQPRDGDPRACYAIFRPDQNTVEFRRVPYDIKRTRRKIIRAGLPRFTAQRLTLGR